MNTPLNIDEIVAELNKNEDFKYLKSLYAPDSLGAFYLPINSDSLALDQVEKVVDYLYSVIGLRNFNPTLEEMVIYINYFYYIVSILDTIRPMLTNLKVDRKDKESYTMHPNDIEVWTSNLTGNYLDIIFKLENNISIAGKTIKISLNFITSGWGMAYIKKADYSEDLFTYLDSPMGMSVSKHIQNLNKAFIIDQYNDFLDRKGM